MARLNRLQRAYALLLAHDREYGNDEGLDECSLLLSKLLTAKQREAVDRQLAREYAASGMELEED